MITLATLAVVVFMCIAALFAYGIVNANYSSEHDSLISLNSGWTLTDSYGRVIEEDISLPCERRADGESVTFSRLMSSADAPISALVFNSKRQSVSVSLDGEDVYQVNCSGLYRYLATTGPNIVRVRPGDASTLSFTVSGSPDGTFALSAIYGSGIDRINYYIFQYDFVTVANICILLIFSLILLLAVAYLVIKHTYDITVFVLLGFGLMMAAWAYSDSALHCLNGISSEAAALVAYALAPFIPIAILTYTSFVCRGAYGSLRVLLLLDCGITLMRALLAVGGLAKLNTTVWLTFLFILLSLSVCLYCTWKEYSLRPGKFTLGFFLVFVLGCGSVVITIIAYAVGLGALYRSIMITIVSCLFICIAVMGVFSNATAQVSFRRDLDRMQVLENEANTDSLTGLSNRNAFDKLMDDIARDPESYASAILVMLDLNGLKYVNDTFSHAAGDELIVNAAKCITETVGKNAYCFRIGGDEFTVVLHNCPGSVRLRVAEMNRWIEEHNETAEYKLSIAHGESPLRYQSGGLRTISDWKQDADINMYNNKNLNSFRHVRVFSTEYQNILRLIINGSDNLESCRRDIEHGLGRVYDPEIGRIVLDNWDELTRLLLKGRSGQGS